MNKLHFLLITAVICLLLAVPAQAAWTAMGAYQANTVPETVANLIVVDGEGVDWTGAVLLVELTSGSVYNGVPDSNGPQQLFWGVPGFEHLEFDTWFGVPGDGTNGIAGGAGDLSGGPLEVGPEVISVSWFNTSTNDTGLTRIANVSFSYDAFGPWSLITSFADGTIQELSGVLEGGAVTVPLPPPWPEPGMAALLVVGGTGLLRRRMAV